jgi:hypothetical protein
MKKQISFTRYLILLVLIIVTGFSAFAVQRSPRISNYVIKADLDPDEKIIDGVMTFSWRNPSQDTVSVLQFHLYLNAFKNTESTFWVESDGQLRGKKVKDSDSKIWGWIDILKMETEDGTDLSSGIYFIQPDDDNENDQTVIEVPLENPVTPGNTITLQIKFRSKLPKIFARTGYSDYYFLVGQWFPKIGVYEPAGMRYAKKGQWNCHQFHGNSEFYANFSNYEVDITVPKRFVVGATGWLESKIENDDETVTLKYKATDVVDFAWTASPLFHVVEDQWKDVKIMVYLQPEHAYLADRHTQSVKAALAYFDENLGKYPYSTITVVDPPIKGSGSAGMEYPSFITAGSLWGMPEEFRLIENVTIHEFGHNYFMGILASNEFEEAWLDEGFNTYYETRIMNFTYGEKTSLIGFRNFHIGDGESQRLGYTGMKNPKIAEVFRYAWQYPHGGYGNMSYNKTATWLMTLEGMVGTETMDHIMKTYFERWKFKHPCATDFIAIVNEVVKKEHGNKFGEDMNWYFDQVLYGSDVCDYKLGRIRNKKIKPPRGIHEVNEKKMTFKSDDYDNEMYESKVIVYRLGEVILPVEVLVHFENGDEVLETWGGKSRTKEFSYERPEEIVWAMVDPDEKIKLDINVMNNGITTEPEKKVSWKYTAKFLFFLQNFMQTISLFA